MPTHYLEVLSDIDIYLFDQILKGRFDHCKIILDAGCGAGRNLFYFLQNDFEVFGIDEDPEAIFHVKQLAQQLNRNDIVKNFSIASIEQMHYEDETFDLVICSAVLHFARDKNHFEQMLQSCWRVLKPGGYFFARLASDIGIESLLVPTGNGSYLLPDGSERYLVNLEQILDYTTALGGTLFEPVKTTNVQNMRCMTTWCIQKEPT